MKRRTFLRVLGGITAAAVVAPQVLIDAVQGDAATLGPLAGPAWDRLPAIGAVTYEMLERAYREAALGKNRPPVVICSRSMARRYGLIFEMDVAA